MLVQGYDFNMYKKIFLASDFQMDQMTGSIYNTDEKHDMEPELLAAWEGFAGKYEKNWSDYEKEVWEEAKTSNKVSVHFLGISESVFDKLEWRGDAASWDEFKSGEYIIVDYGDSHAKEPFSYYHKGESFQMKYSNGNVKDYQVLGEALMPYSLDYPYADMIFITVMVPEDEYIARTG